MKLFFKETENADPVIPVRWCLCPNDHKELLANGVKFPKMFLVIAKGNKEISRALVPLQQELHYLQFHSPGDCTVHAQLVYSPDDQKNDKTICDYFLYQWPSREYQHSALDYKGEPQQPWGHKVGISIITTESIHLNISPGLFASEPPAWEQRMFEAFFRTRATDQCDHRRRMCIFYPLSPLILAVVIAISCITTCFKAIYAFFLLIAGRRGVHWKHLVNPLIWNHRRIWNPDMDNYACAYFTKADGTPRFSSNWLEMRRKKRRERVWEERDSRKEKREKVWRELVCAPHKNFAPNITDLPPERQTVYLRLCEIKRRVCRPFVH